MKNDNFYKTLRIVCLILAIVCMALSLFKKAKAEDFELQPFDNYFYDYIDTTYHITGSQNIFSNFTDVPTDTWQYVEVSNSADILGFIFNDKRLDVSNFSVTSNSYNTNELKYETWDGRASMCSTYDLNYNNVVCYYINYKVGGYGTRIYKINFGTKSYLNGSSNPDTKCSVTRTTLYTYNWQSFNSETVYGTFNINDTLKFYNYRPTFGYCNTPYGWWTAIGTGTKGTHIELEHQPDLNTDGFDVYKYGSENNQKLVCDFTECISISDAVGNSSTVSLVLNIDSVETTLNFDSTSEYYYYTGNYNNAGARYSLPFSALGITPNTINANLISVNVINTTSSPGGSYNKSIWWVTPITLVGSSYEDETASVISKDTLPDYDHFDDPATQQSYKETTNRWLTSTYNTLPLSLFNRWNFEVKYKVIPVYQEGLGSAALNAFLTAITQALNLQFGDVVETAIELYNGHSIYEIIDDILLNNNYAEYYDLIAFCYQDSNGSDPVYYIYTTDSYNNHLTNSYLYDIMQTIYDDGKALDSIYNYLYDRLDDFETKSLNKMNEAVGLGEIENNLLEKIRKLLDQILAAILNLDLEVPEANYTDIIDKLDTIIENQDTSDINDDWYQNYREWLYGINENDSYLSPHEYFNNIFGTLKTTFDSFTNNISFNAYLLKVEDFINHISGSTTDNLTIYLRDGIGDPGFNINNNYMYTVGGSQ